jgi:hypothetical protein
MSWGGFANRSPSPSFLVQVLFNTDDPLSTLARKAGPPLLILTELPALTPHPA